MGPLPDWRKCEESALVIGSVRVSGGHSRCGCGDRQLILSVLSSLQVNISVASCLIRPSAYTYSSTKKSQSVFCWHGICIGKIVGRTTWGSQGSAVNEPSYLPGPPVPLTWGPVCPSPPFPCHAKRMFPPLYVFLSDRPSNELIDESVVS